MCVVTPLTGFKFVFLQERTQKVILDGATSRPAKVLSGVPQGTVLGPLLFLVYINDLPQYVSPGTEVRLFADDSAVYRKITNINDAVILQKDLDNLQRWEKQWSMEFHPNKCQLLRITKRKNTIDHAYNIHGTAIQLTKDAKYLGITISNNLSWNTHINNICKKANSTINFLYRNFGSCSKEIKQRLYFSHVRPQLEYCSAIWDPHTQTNIAKLEAVQRRAARFVSGVFSREEHVTPILQKLNWIPLEERRARTKVTIMFKALNHLIDVPTDHLVLTQNSTRSHNNFCIPYCRTDTHRSAFFSSTIRLWNTLPVNIRCAPSTTSFQGSLTTQTLRQHY